MIQVDRAIFKQYKDGELSQKAFADYLLRTFPASEIALALVETLDIDYKPIAITQEEFNLHFRIRGIKADGSVENRGRRNRSEDKAVSL